MTTLTAPARRRTPPRTLTYLIVAGAAWAVCAAALWVEVPDALRLGAAVLATTALVAALAHRAGLPVAACTVTTGALALLAALTQSVTLLSGVAVVTAVAAALAGIVVTRPTSTLPSVVFESSLGLLLALLGGAVAAAYRPEVDGERATVLAVVLALAGAAGLMAMLGIDLGRRGLVALLVAVAVVGLMAVYAYALDRWVTSGWIEDIRDQVAQVRDLLGAVPRPLVMLLGVPALVWGCSLRARRPQGWWVTALSAPGMAVVASLLLRADVEPLEGLLIVVYSALPGLALGWAVVRVDRYLSGQGTDDGVMRPEPPRWAPLR